MASTPMDIDRSNTPNGASLNIHRTIGTTASVSNLSDVIGNFRPTKVRRTRLISHISQRICIN
jgi:COMPASS component SWD2